MRIFVLGAGATGSLLAELLQRQGHTVWCGDRDPERARHFLGERSTIAVAQVNARNMLGIVRAARGCQLIVNASASVFNLIVLRAALRLRAHYVDLSSHLTRNPFKAEQFSYAKRFEEKNRTALINAGAGGVPQELFHMAAVNKLRVYVAVPEVDSLAAQNGATATLTLDEFPGEIFQGTIVRNSDSIDLASRTLNVEVDVDNAQNRIKTGAYAFVQLKIPRSPQTATQSLTIPANTLLFRSEGLRVGVIRNGRAELVPITIGRDFGAAVEVVAGLQPTDQVIVNPSDSLASGNRLQVSAPQTGGWK